jgi:hypothetical protein
MLTSSESFFSAEKVESPIPLAKKISKESWSLAELNLPMIENED